MKKFLYILILSFLYTSCNDKNLVIQTVSCASDCIKCDGWSWNNGVATVRGESDQFYFKTTVSGDLSFYYKLNSSYYPYIHVQGAASFQDYNKESLYKWTLVKSGHVDIGKMITVVGKECSIKDIKIVGSIDDNNQKDNNDPPQWDF